MIREFEEKIFMEWSTDRDGFVSDGVVNEDIFIANNLRIGFLLKEVNSEDRFWDLREFISHGAQASSWNNITRWIIGIENLSENIHWDKLSEISIENRKKYLNKVAVINLKKTPGGSSSDMDEVSDSAAKDEAFLKRQIDYYNFDILICCGTSDIYHKEIEKDKKTWLMSSKGIWYYKNPEGGYVIAWKHPQWCVSSNMLYYPLIDTIRELMGN